MLDEYVVANGQFRQILCVAVVVVGRLLQHFSLPLLDFPGSSLPFWREGSPVRR
jgi:hypothetical protein